MTSRPLPEGFVVRLVKDTWRVGSGSVLVGGWPKRVARLSPAAAVLLHEGTLTVTDAASRALADYLLTSGLGVPVVDELPPVPLSDLTVVIPTRGRTEQLQRLLASLPDGLAGAIVIDDGSENPEAVKAVAADGGAAVISLPTNIGPAGARNVGLAEVETPFVGFIDSDVVVVAGALDRMLRHFGDPAVAVVAPRVWGLQTDNPNAITRYENARSSLDLGADPALVRPHSNVTWVSSTCLVARVAALGDGFDAALRVGEDVDIVWRLAAEGWRIRYEPEAAVMHEHRTTVTSWLGRKFVYGTGALGLAERHPNAIAPAVLPPWGVALLASLALQRRFSVPLAAAIGLAVLGRTWVTIGPMPQRFSVSLRLVLAGILAALVQGSALVLRHWWPGVAILVPFSRRARRAVLLAAVFDTAVELIRLRVSTLGPMEFALARRLDDAAYGAGVWWASLRGRNLRAVKLTLQKKGKRTNRSGT